MRHLNLIFLFIFCFLGCEENSVPPPFSKEKMQTVLMEVHLTDASVSTLLGSKKDSMATVYLDQVKSINKVTDKDIEAIFAYLKDHPAYAEEIYGGMIKEINERQRSEKKDKKEKRDKKEVPK